MGERTSNEMENLSIQTKTRFPRDLLRRFTVGSADAGPHRRSDPEDDLGSGSGDEVELNLGLSLGGRFGVDKSNTKLVRSSSIAAILPVVRDDDVLASGAGSTGPGRSYSGLIRTSSLPVETEEEWRKRKELQSLRRLAAKRRRSEKQRNLTRGEREEYVAAMSRVGSSPGPPFGSDKWPSSGGTTTAGGTGSGGGGGGLSSPASQESQGSMSEYQSTHRQGSSGSGGETSSLQERNDHHVIGSSCSKPPAPAGGGDHRESTPARNQGKEIRSSSMEEMPCVFTQGDGPNGRVIEGILYKYGRGEQVKILCACHGSFLSPAEFVKHAGGSDVLHPLRHIVVKPSSFS
ncbi:ninja-family protein AFP1 [Lactuca sativa]|uniref:Ninja-family protein n=1 Tax=Lactuca sativa TaxID=4236 RepID=A0A9R1W7T5_LACSA|nr:ninja-family protein AFP1 [Lactuca sativa]KAJ0217433.1 hypothetical protein LSAT_V11C300122890 [Lactuca sativa]